MYFTIRQTSPGSASGDVSRGEGVGLQALQQLPVDEVPKISLRRENESPMVFHRTQGRWEQAEPFPFPMDLFSIRQFAVHAMQVARAGTFDRVTLDETTSDEAMGFNPPRATLEFEWSGESGGASGGTGGAGGSLAVELGRLVGAGRGYLRIKGQPDIYSVNQILHQRAIQMNPNEWRDRKLFHEVSVEADSIERIVRADHLLVKREEGQWKMVLPVATRVNGLALQQWIQNLEAARVASFVVDQPDDLARLGLDPPEAQITYTSTRRVEVDGQVYSEPVVQRLLVGSTMGAQTGDRFAMIEGRPVVFRLSIEDQQKILIMRGELVALTATGVTPSDVKQIIVRSGDDEMRIQRDLEVWSSKPDDRPIEPQFIGDLLRLIMELRPQSIKLDAYPADQEIGTITLLGFDLRPLDTVRIARDLETGRYILENGDGVLRYFPESVTMRLTPRDFGLESPIDP
jgi:hypothetical protein